MQLPFHSDDNCWQDHSILVYLRFCRTTEKPDLRSQSPLEIGSDRHRRSMVHNHWCDDTNQGQWTILPFDVSFRDSASSCSVWTLDFVTSEILKNSPTDFWDNTNKIVFLSVTGTGFTQVFLLALALIPWSVIQIIDWHVRPRSHTHIGSAKSPWLVIIPGCVSNSKKWYLLGSPSPSKKDKVTNDKTRKRAQNG